MRVLVQRVTEARVTVAGEVVGAIGCGLLLLLAVVKGDSEESLRRMVHKVANLRIFVDDDGKMNRSVKDTAGQVLVVSQFTLAGELNKGFRPSFSKAEEPQRARQMVDQFCQRLAAALDPPLTPEFSSRVSQGRFGADMQVYLVNDGPVTLWLDVI